MCLDIYLLFVILLCDVFLVELCVFLVELDFEVNGIEMVKVW